MNNCIVFLGKTGAGKDTQADLLQKHYGVSIIRLGDLVRELSKTNAHVAHQLEKGVLVDDPIVDELMTKAIQALPKGATFVSDGYPRHIQQAHTLEALLASSNTSLAAVVYFALPDSEARLRLQLRTRDDDTPDAILERLTEFHMSTEKVIDYFKDHSKFIEIDATKTPEQVFENVTGQLKKNGVLQ